MEAGRRRRSNYSASPVAVRYDLSAVSGFVCLESGAPTHRNELYHGDIVHGLQFHTLKRRYRPTTYYSLGSGVDFSIRHHPKRLAREDGNTAAPGMRIGVIGMGIGTIATYGWE
ncbi:MAG: hypothetical protein O3C43_13790 [Verrucomicrobia bacterium]|nr:hypothetical protein [Verrucomicrobiota bacterium]MDA1067564.1 hypothetical protein [Verrucomicrobiota bacterium]